MLLLLLIFLVFSKLFNFFLLLLLFCLIQEFYNSEGFSLFSKSSFNMVEFSSSNNSFSSNFNLEKVFIVYVLKSLKPFFGLVYLGFSNGLVDLEFLTGSLFKSIMYYMSNNSFYVYYFISICNIIMKHLGGYKPLFEFLLLCKCLLMSIGFGFLLEGSFFEYEIFYFLYQDFLVKSMKLSSSVQSFSGLFSFILDYNKKYGSFYSLPKVMSNMPKDYFYISGKSCRSGFVSNSVDFYNFSKEVFYDYKDSSFEGNSCFSFFNFKDSKCCSLVFLNPKNSLLADNYFFIQSSGYGLTPNEIIYGSIGYFSSVSWSLKYLETMSFSKWYLTSTSKYTDSYMKTVMSGVLVLGNEFDYNLLPLSDFEDAKSYFKGNYEAEAGGKKDMETLLNLFTNDTTSWMGVKDYNIPGGLGFMKPNKYGFEDELKINIYFSPVFFPYYCVNKTLITSDFMKEETMAKSVVSASSEFFSSELSSELISKSMSEGSISSFKISFVKVWSADKSKKDPILMLTGDLKKKFSLKSTVSFKSMSNLVNPNHKEGFLSLFVLGGEARYSGGSWSCKCCGPLMSSKSCCLSDKTHFITSVDGVLVLSEYKYKFHAESLDWPKGIDSELEVSKGLELVLEEEEFSMNFDKELMGMNPGVFFKSEEPSGIKIVGLGFGSSTHNKYYLQSNEGVLEEEEEEWFLVEGVEGLTNY